MALYAGIRRSKDFRARVVLVDRESLFIEQARKPLPRHMAFIGSQPTRSPSIPEGTFASNALPPPKALLPPNPSHTVTMA